MVQMLRIMQLLSRIEEGENLGGSPSSRQGRGGVLPGSPAPAGASLFLGCVCSSWELFLPRAEPWAAALNLEEFPWTVKGQRAWPLASAPCCLSQE